MGPKYKSSVGYHLIKREHASRDGSIGADVDDDEANDDWFIFTVF